MILGRGGAAARRCRGLCNYGSDPNASIHAGPLVCAYLSLHPHQQQDIFTVQICTYIVKTPLANSSVYLVSDISSAPHDFQDIVALQNSSLWLFVYFYFLPPSLNFMARFVKFQ